MKEDKYTLGYVIGNSIQENKDKIEKLEKQNIRLKNKNKKLKQELEKKNKILNELKEWLEDNWKQSQDIWYIKIINKIKELEKDSD
jgi:predicted nuclease with TOPRIM domain